MSLVARVALATIISCSTSSLAFAQASSPSQPPAAAQQQPQCEFRYATRLADAALTARADIRARALQDIADQIDAGRGSRNSATIAIGARYSVFAAGGLAQEAYTETVSSYFCFLRRRYAGNASMLTRLNRARNEIIRDLVRYFDVGVWQISNIDARNQIGDEILNTPAAEPLFPTDVAAALERPNFDAQKLYEITAEVSIPNFVNIGSCAGLVERSIRRVSPDFLASLGLIRPMLVERLTGDLATARFDLWNFASSRMNHQLGIAQNATEQVNADANLAACVRSARDAAQAEQAAAIAREQAITNSSLQAPAQPPVTNPQPVTGGQVPTLTPTPSAPPAPANPNGSAQ